ncbi:acetyl-CoA transporter, putative [Eimeria tenella]|uniref:Acetyl-CoA transporter, putative n=1 Tax=Eimeria tenella TaxID=5802 RepID=U6KY28_EIMTE|nr:acetyl-CoA transporter, putative [Eimeria tenella]CDJ41239.1 acetyl-CoA transporter, putative [Eimeria tenella]|eukprot:XP_013231989.1 acetyl-CoA transporter, putative [Eimeria tenella]
MPFGIVCPFLVSKWITGSAPLRLFMRGYLLRLCVCCIWAATVAATPFLHNGDHSILFYVCLFVITTLYNVCSDLMFVSMMAFFARVSDPRIGGSYMTFLNTMANIGSQWPRAVSLWLMDPLTRRDCTGVNVSAGEKCPVVLDGYFVQVGAGVVLGLCWVAIFWPRVKRLQQEPLSSWRVSLTGAAAAAAAKTAAAAAATAKPAEEIELKSAAAAGKVVDVATASSISSSRSSSSSSSGFSAADNKKQE